MYCLWVFNPLAGDKSPLSSVGTGMFPQQVVRTLFLAARALEACCPERPPGLLIQLTAMQEAWLAQENQLPPTIRVPQAPGSGPLPRLMGWAYGRLQLLPKDRAGLASPGKKNCLGWA